MTAARSARTALGRGKGQDDDPNGGRGHGGHARLVRAPPARPLAGSGERADPRPDRAAQPRRLPAVQGLVVLGSARHRGNAGRDGDVVQRGDLDHRRRAAPPERARRVGGAAGSGKTSACMHPFGWRASDPQRRAALVLEVKGDFCFAVRGMLEAVD